MHRWDAAIVGIIPSLGLVEQVDELMNKKTLSERDICTNCITPGIAAGDWSADPLMREGVDLTDGRVVVRGDKAHRDKSSTRRID